MVEKFVSPAPPATPREREILEILIEECGEVIQRATKSLRFGPAEIQPGQKHDNTERLSLELGDLHTITQLAMTEGVVRGGLMMIGADNKRDQLAKFMQTTPSPKDGEK